MPLGFAVPSMFTRFPPTRKPTLTTEPLPSADSARLPAQTLPSRSTVVREVFNPRPSGAALYSMPRRPPNSLDVAPVRFDGDGTPLPEARQGGKVRRFSQRGAPVPPRPPALRPLLATWYHKWLVHRRLRPKAFGELDKLASNVSLGRNAAGIHWRSDSVQGLHLGEDLSVARG